MWLTLSEVTPLGHSAMRNKHPADAGQIISFGALRKATRLLPAISLSVEISDVKEIKGSFLERFTEMKIHPMVELEPLVGDQ